MTNFGIVCEENKQVYLKNKYNFLICNPVLSYILGFLYGRGDLIGGVEEQLTCFRYYLSDLRHLGREIGEEPDRQTEREREIDK